MHKTFVARLLHITHHNMGRFRFQSCLGVCASTNAMVMRKSNHHSGVGGGWEISLDPRLHARQACEPPFQGLPSDPPRCAHTCVQPSGFHPKGLLAASSRADYLLAPLLNELCSDLSAALFNAGLNCAQIVQPSSRLCCASPPTIRHACSSCKLLRHLWSGL